MKIPPLWPLLPPVAVLGMIFLFLSFSGELENAEAQPLPMCGVKKLTGFHCPGCGGTRCAQNIIEGNWLGAFGYNPLLMSGFILVMAICLYLIVRITLLGKAPPRIANINTQWIWLGLAGIALFTILRNIPTYPFTLLAP